MKKILLLGMIAWLGVATAYSQEKLKSKGVIPIMSWGGISQSEVSAESYKKLKEVGVNIDIAFFSNADAIALALDAASKAGIKLMISCPELKTDPEKTTERFKNHPALEGYYLGDEPGEPQFRGFSRLGKEIKSN